MMSGGIGRPQFTRPEAQDASAPSRQDPRQDQQQTPARLRQRADEADRRMDRQAQEDIVVEHPRRLFLRSADGTYWQLGVNDLGALTTTNVGTKL